MSKGPIGELAFTVSIKRKATGLTDTYQMVGIVMQQEPEAQYNAEPVAPPAPEPQAMQNPEPEPTLVLESMPAAASVAVPDVLEPEAEARVVSGPDAHDTPVTGAQPDKDAPRGFFGYARTWAGRFMRPRGGGADDKA